MFPRRAIALVSVASATLLVWLLWPRERAPVAPDPAAPHVSVSESSDVPSGLATPEGPASLVEPPLATAGAHLSGRVRDERGQPWTSFTVRLRPGNDGEGSAGDRRALERDFASDDGSFTVADVARGRWLVSAVHGLASEEREVRVEADDVRDLELVLPRPARIAGRVVDPSGLAPSGAALRLLRADASRAALRAEAPLATDGEGRFALELAAGRLVLQAEAAGWAASAALELELAPGGERADLVLALRRAGRIVGRALDEHGDPDAGREVWLSSPARRDLPTATATADAQGAFEFGGLPPGEVEVVRIATRADEARAAASAEGSRSLARLRTATRLELGEGETVEVVLGGASEPGVRLAGFVLGAPAGRDTLFVEARPLDATDATRRPFSRLDEQGAYALLLDGPGTYALSVQDREGVLLSLEVSVADLPSQRLDLELGEGSIAGRVLGPNGAPVERAEVSLSSLPDPAAPAAGRASSSRRAESDAHGAFAFERLAPGRYALAARAGRNAPAASPGASTAAARLEGLELAPRARLDGLELRLETGAAIEVLVTSRAGPVGGAEVRAVDAHGRTADAPPARPTDAAGRTRLAGLPAGTWFLRASDERLAGPWSEPIAVGAGESASARIELGPGAFLHVDVRGARAPGTALVLRDARGLELARGWAPAGTGSATLGPLPLGRFLLEAEDAGGRTRALDVTLDSEQPAALTLDLGA